MPLNDVASGGDNVSRKDVADALKYFEGPSENDEGPQAPLEEEEDDVSNGDAPANWDEEDAVEPLGSVSATDDADAPHSILEDPSEEKKTDDHDGAPSNGGTDAAAVTVPDTTTSDALSSLSLRSPVSISADTAHALPRGMLYAPGAAPPAGATSDAARAATAAAVSPSRSRRRRKKNSGAPALGPDEAANRHAAKAFSRAVRLAIEAGNPEEVTTILHDPAYSRFALDAPVLEAVLRYLVLSASFSEAAYVLRNRALPSTLSVYQTERTLLTLPQNLRNSSAFGAADMIDALCVATSFPSGQSSRAYFQRIVRGISLEFLEEATAARDRICSAPCERLVRGSQCVVDARLRRGRRETEVVVEPGHQLGVFVPETLDNRGIQAGDAVGILPYAGPYPMSAESLDRNMIEATVASSNPLVLRLQDKSNRALLRMLLDPSPGNVYRIDKLANRMGFNRQLEAARIIAAPPDVPGDRGGGADARRPSEQLVRAITAMDENIAETMMGVSSGRSRDPGRPGPIGTAALCSQAVGWDDSRSTEEDDDTLRSTAALALEKYGAVEGMNSSQRMAVCGAAANRLTLIQGPPGTGKTAVAIRILSLWSRMCRGRPVLATSDSNIAVDNLVEGCAAAGLRVVRLGRPEAVRPELLKHCVDRPPSSAGGGGPPPPPSGNAFKEKRRQLRSAQVICCTCIGSGGDILDGMTFDRVLVDEATQASEPAVLVPITRGCRQLVLVGDHCQLPPTVLSTKAEEEGLGVPLFSRLVACGVPPFMLDTQYRMHPAIAMFVSDLFYGGKLLNGVTAPERRPLAGFPWPREEFPVAFVPVAHGIEMDDGVSKMNEAEAAAATDAVSALLQGGCAVGDIAVVTPYAAQVRLLRRMIRQLVQHPPYVEVSSTDGFQGREKEAVIFSSVRSNSYGQVGFVSDWRRVNVSFTRARRALIVIGNDSTLRRGDPETWAPWLAWADAHGVNMDKPGVPRGRYDPETLRRVRGGTTAAEMLKDVLQRQQAQLKIAANQLKKAERNSAGHIRGETKEEAAMAARVKGIASAKEDLMLMSNSDGHWDEDSDEGEKDGSKRKETSSGPSISISVTPEVKDVKEPMDAWDV